MAKIVSITEHFQHFLTDLKESFWGDLEWRVKEAAQRYFALLSERQRDSYMVSPRYAKCGAQGLSQSGLQPRLCNQVGNATPAGRTDAADWAGRGHPERVAKIESWAHG